MPITREIVCSSQGYGWRRSACCEYPLALRSPRSVVGNYDQCLPVCFSIWCRSRHFQRTPSNRVRFEACILQLQLQSIASDAPRSPQLCRDGLDHSRYYTLKPCRSISSGGRLAPLSPGGPSSFFSRTANVPVEVANRRACIESAKHDLQPLRTSFA